jgi:phosphatidylglycerol---prolipoprotein diacylglyceryl transferase
MAREALLHLLFESLAYAIGSALYLRMRRNQGDPLTGSQRSSVFAAAIVGAAIGSKILGWFDHPGQLAARWQDPVFLLGGKTIVGGLIGGWILVEIVKRAEGIRTRSGDLFAIPLAIGIAIGRIGCFLGGLADETFGLPTNLPWAIDFGDGIRRHPTQLYEILWLLALAQLLWRARTQPRKNGDLFKLFMIGYMGFRLLMDFLKPADPIFGLTAIQWACVGTLLFYAPEMPRLVRIPFARWREQHG